MASPRPDQVRILNVGPSRHSTLKIPSGNRNSEWVEFPAPDVNDGLNLKLPLHFERDRKAAHSCAYYGLIDLETDLATAHRVCSRIPLTWPVA